MTCAHMQGPDKPGNCGPYRQSERKEIYAKMAKQLVDSGAAYPCFTTGQSSFNELDNYCYSIARMRYRTHCSSSTYLRYAQLCR
jgi:glutamyl/glutaminyl-tRNA synthetase